MCLVLYGGTVGVGDSLKDACGLQCGLYLVIPA